MTIKNIAKHLFYTIYVRKWIISNAQTHLIIIVGLFIKLNQLKIIQITINCYLLNLSVTDINISNVILEIY